MAELTAEKAALAGRIEALETRETALRSEAERWRPGAWALLEPAGQLAETEVSGTLPGSCYQGIERTVKVRSGVG